MLLENTFTFWQVYLTAHQMSSFRIHKKRRGKVEFRFRRSEEQQCRLRMMLLRKKQHEPSNDIQLERRDYIEPEYK